MDKYNLLQRIKKLFKGMYIKILFKRSHLKFKIAKEKEDLELVCHLRWRTYGQELKYINPKEYRGGKRLISFGLLKKAFEFSKQKGITHWYALMGEKLKNSFEKYGIKISILSYGEFTESHLKEREIMSHYYKEIKPLPYLISLKEIGKML